MAEGVRVNFEGGQRFDRSSCIFPGCAKQEGNNAFELNIQPVVRATEGQGSL